MDNFCVTNKIYKKGGSKTPAYIKLNTSFIIKKNFNLDLEDKILYPCIALEN